MSNVLQQIIQDLVGTKRGQAFEQAVQPTLNALTPVGQDLLAVATRHDPQIGQLVTLGETVAQAVNTLAHPESAPSPTGPTEADVVTIMNSALTAMGLPVADDAAFDAALDVAYKNWQAANAQAQGNPT